MIAVPYLDNGYIDVETIRRMTRSTPFVFIIGSRQGAGKTYGVTQSIIRHGENPVIIRRTKDERAKFSNAQISPLRRIDPRIVGDMDGDICILKYTDTEDFFGYVLDLTSATKRGFALEGFNSVFFDECVPEQHAGGARDRQQAETFVNLLITLFGEKPEFMNTENHPKVWIIGNANALDCGIFSAFSITKTIEKMLKRKQTVYISPQRKLSIFLADAPENSRRRSTMPLMQAVAGSATKSMALDNTFVADMTGVRGWPLRDWQALVCFSDAHSAYTIWRHKSRAWIYVTRGAFPARHSVANSKEAFVALGRATARRTRRSFWALVLYSNSGVNAFYDSLTSKQWFLRMKK